MVPLPVGRIYQDANFEFYTEGPFHWTVSEQLGLNGLISEPVIVPPTWNKADSHRALESVWARAAKELAESENIFVIGYSMPETDAFFRHLYALGTVGDTTIRRFWVFNPDHTLEERFRNLLGPGAERAFKFFSGATRSSGISFAFTEAIDFLRQEFPAV